MQNTITPISLTIDAKRTQELIQAAQKSDKPQELKIDIYLVDAQPPATVNIPQGPHKVNRGAWALLPKPKSKPASADKLPPQPPCSLPDCE